MESIRIGNDIRLRFVLALGDGAASLGELPLTVMVIRSDGGVRECREPLETVVVNGAVVGLPVRGKCHEDGERPIVLRYDIVNEGGERVLYALWPADRQPGCGVYDVVVGCNLYRAGQSVADVAGAVELVAHSRDECPGAGCASRVVELGVLSLTIGRGLDAYEVARLEGFKGSRSEWLASLVGNVELEGYATKEYVDGAVAGVSVDLSGLAIGADRLDDELKQAHYKLSTSGMVKTFSTVYTGGEAPGGEKSYIDWTGTTKTYRYNHTGAAYSQPLSSKDLYLYSGKSATYDGAGSLKEAHYYRWTGVRLEDVHDDEWVKETKDFVRIDGDSGELVLTSDGAAANLTGCGVVIASDGNVNVIAAERGAVMLSSESGNVGISTGGAVSIEAHNAVSIGSEGQVSIESGVDLNLTGSDYVTINADEDVFVNAQSLKLNNKAVATEEYVNGAVANVQTGGASVETPWESSIKEHLGVSGGQVYLDGYPVATQEYVDDAYDLSGYARKSDVDNALTDRLSKALGGTVSGPTSFEMPLQVPTPTAGGQAANKSYVDDKVLKDLPYTGSLRLNDVVQDGVYKIHGVRTGTNDDLPIDLTGGYVSGRLTVTRGDDGGVAMVSQLLTLNNFGGSDARTFTRCFRNDESQWRPWQELQGMNLVGHVLFGDMWRLVDNGMYSGVFAGVNGNAASAITGVLVVVNNYAAATAAGVQKHVTQYLMGVDLDGSGTGLMMRTFANTGSNPGAVAFAAPSGSVSLDGYATQTYVDNAVANKSVVSAWEDEAKQAIAFGSNITLGNNGRDLNLIGYVNINSTGNVNVNTVGDFLYDGRTVATVDDVDEAVEGCASQSYVDGKVAGVCRVKAFTAVLEEAMDMQPATAAYISLLVNKRYYPEVARVELEGRPHENLSRDTLYLYTGTVSMVTGVYGTRLVPGALYRFDGEKLVGIAGVPGDSVGMEVIVNVDGVRKLRTYSIAATLLSETTIEE